MSQKIEGEAEEEKKKGEGIGVERDMLPAEGEVASSDSELMTANQSIHVFCLSKIKYERVRRIKRE